MNYQFIRITLSITLCLTLVEKSAYSQIGSRAPMTLADVLDPNYLNSDLREPNDKNIKGSQFTDDWTKGSITLSANTFDNLQMRYNGFTDDIWIKREDQNLIISKQYVRFFTTERDQEKIKYINYNSAFYRELFASDSLTFLAKDKIFLIEGEASTGYNSGSTSDEFKLKTQYYILRPSRDKLEEIKLRKKNLDQFTSGKRKKYIKNQLGEDNLKINSEEGMVRMFELLFN